MPIRPALWFLATGVLLGTTPRLITDPPWSPLVTALGALAIAAAAVPAWRAAMAAWGPPRVRRLRGSELRTVLNATGKVPSGED